jgi:hypothetical protein
MTNLFKYKVALILMILTFVFFIMYVINLKKEVDDYKIYNANLR